MISRSLLAIVLGLTALTAARAALPPPLPAQAKTPFLYVRFAGPPGLQVSFFQGLTPARTQQVPVTAGLRPGYPYRVRLAGWPQNPGLAVYPTLEVRGTLHLPPKMSAATYPVPVVITEADLERVAAGSLVTKVIYLECPDLALAAATQPDQPLELTLPVGQDPLEEARQRGRPMLIVRLGLREVSPEELAHETVAGTVLLPGDRFAPPPTKPPFIPWASWQVYDPHLGPKPDTEECLQDGGDIGPRAGFGPDGRLAGVDPSDSVAEYVDDQGRRRLACSNRICLCVPRFGVLRVECPLARYDTLIAPTGAQKVLSQNQLEMRVPSREAEQYKPILAMTGRNRPTEALARQGPSVLMRVEVLQPVQIEIGPAVLLCTKGVLTLTEVQRARLLRQIELARELSKAVGTREVDQVEGTAVLGKVQGLDVIRATVETRDLTVCCTEPAPLGKPLCLFKWADAKAAQVGDVVTFHLKYSNQGGQPITDVAVVDSLTGRLEYVAGSAKSSRAAVFTTQENEAGSVILRWEINGRLLPGENGVVSFQARIR